jgi:hypothetical protein
LAVAAGRNRRRSSTAARGSWPEPSTPALDEKTVPHARAGSFGGAEWLEPSLVAAEEPDDGPLGAEHVVNAWRAEQLRLLGLPPMLAEAFAGLVDWHQIAELVERGCSAQLALEIVR